MIPVRDFPSDYHNLDQGWHQLGSGSFRMAFCHDDYPGLVLKIARREQAIAHNKRECDLWESHSETFFSFALTPIVARNADYSAILMKRVRTLMSFEVDDAVRNQIGDIYWDRFVIRWWQNHFPKNSADFHTGNWGYVQDDYGYLTPGPLIDYAGC